MGTASMETEQHREQEKEQEQEAEQEEEMEMARRYKLIERRLKAL